VTSRLATLFSDPMESLSARIRDASDLLTSKHYAVQPARLAAAAAYAAGTLSDLDLQQQAWELFAGALRTTISGGANWNNLQVVAVPSEVHWDDPDYGEFYFHKLIGDLINEIGPTYRKGSHSFSEQYGEFLNDVLRPVVDQAALEESRTALTNAATAQSQHETLVYNISLEWQAFDDRQTSSLPPSKWLQMEDWYERFGQNQVIEASFEIVLANWARFYQLIQKAFGGGETLAQMIYRFRNAGLLEINEPRTGSVRPAGKIRIYPYQIAPDYPSWLADAKAGRHQITKFTINKSTYSYDYSASSIGAGIGIGFGFFGILAGGIRRTVQIDSSNSAFSLSFSADLQTFDVMPGDWYSSNAFSLFANGPFVPNSPMDLRSKSGTLFGPKGFLSFRPARAIVAYKPTVTVQMSKHDYHYFKQVTSGTAGFFIGPFAIGVGSYYDIKESVRWDDQNLTLTLYNAPETPHLLAFDSEDLP
jgi:hypothetical protein